MYLKYRSYFNIMHNEPCLIFIKTELLTDYLPKLTSLRTRAYRVTVYFLLTVIVVS